MAFTRPTLEDIVKRIKGDYRSGLSLKRIVRRSFLDVFAKANAAVSHTLHGHIVFALVKKFFPDTGDEQTVTRWGTLYSTPRLAAQKTELNITVTGTSGGTVPADAVYVREDGTEYVVQEEVEIPEDDTAEVLIAAADGFEGADANMEAGETLNLQSPIAGVESEAEVASVEVSGEDRESLDNYRTRVLQRLQQPPAGGKATDYIAFARAVAGVTRVWVLPGHLGEGTVGITFVEDGNEPASIIPDSAKVDEVQLAIDNNGPINSDDTVFAPTAAELDLDIQIKPNNSDVRAAVEAEIKDLLSRQAQVRGAVDPQQVGEGVTYDGVIRISQIREAISIAAGEQDHVLNSPTADFQPQVGGLVVLGDIQFSTLA